MISKIFFLFLILLACSKDTPLLYSKIDIMKMTFEGDQDAKEILPENIDQGIRCTDYGPGCQKGYMAKILGLQMTFIEFDTPENALAAAKRMNAMYARNWVFDEVVGEPPLEKFFEKYLDAKYAIPKKVLDSSKNES